MEENQETTDLRKSLVTLAQGVIKAAMLINGGSAAALLAFVGQVWSEDIASSVIGPAIYAIATFAFGVFLAAISVALAYFAQLNYYRGSNRSLHLDKGMSSRLNKLNIGTNLTPYFDKVIKRADTIRCWAILIVVISLLAYGTGIIFVVNLVGKLY